MKSGQLVFILLMLTALIGIVASITYQHNGFVMRSNIIQMSKVTDQFVGPLM
jgi:hypothetical protein